MRIFGTVKVLDFEFEEYTDALKEQFEYAYKKAARAFIRAAIDSDRVPVDTGMSRGSFLNLGQMLRVTIPITPKTHFNKNGTVRKPKTYNYSPAKGAHKTPQLGAHLSTPAAAVFTWVGNKLRFEFNTRVFQYNLLDRFGISRNPNSPWKSFEFGREAFVESLAGIRSELPKMTEYIVYTTVSFGKGSDDITFEDKKPWTTRRKVKRNG